jgi:hypothetical protein
MSKYYEDEEDLLARVFLEHAKPIMDSLQIGDYININCFQDDEIQSVFHLEYIDLCDVLSQKRQDMLNYTAHNLYTLEDEDEHNIKIPRIHIVVDIINNSVPIIQAVRFPGEHGYDDRKYSLAYWLYTFLGDLCNDYWDFSKSHKIISNFVKVDSNYADSILLESKFIPYEHDVQKIRDLEVALDKKSKQIKKHKAAQARRERAVEAEMWKDEFFTIVDTYLIKKFPRTL